MSAWGKWGRLPERTDRQRTGRVLGDLQIVFVSALLAAVSVPTAAQTEVVKPTWQEFTDEREERDRIGVGFEYRDFDDTFDDWRTWNVEYAHRFDRGSVLLRANLADRFERDGTQFEIDAYPKLWEGTYLYLNYGYSDDTDVFPEQRYGAEIFESFPHAFEGSLGFRRLEFVTSDVTLWTGSVAKYIGNNWLELRPWVVDKADSSSLSGSIRLRHYLRGAENYWTLRGSYGEKEDDLIIAPARADLDSWSIGVDLQRYLKPRRLQINAKLGFDDREFRPGRWRQSWIVGLELHRYF